MKQLVKAFILLFCCLLIIAGCVGKPTADKPSVTPKTEQETVTPTPEKTISAAEIFVALYARDADKVKQLINADNKLINARDSSDNTPLHVAAMLGHREIVSLLLATKKKVKNPVFGDLYGPSTEGQEMVDVNARDNGDWTPLHYAAKGGYSEIVSLLLDKGANVNAKNNKGDTPLHYAALGGYKEIVELLRRHGGTE